VLGFSRDIADLHRAVTIGSGTLYLGYRHRQHFKNRYRNGVAILVKYLGHTPFLGHTSGQHVLNLVKHVSNKSQTDFFLEKPEETQLERKND
jgi:hypothetical protein